MKRVSLLMLAFVALAITGTAQVKFGAKGGINLANMNSKSEGQKESNDSKVGLHIGGFVEIPVSEKFSVAPELPQTKIRIDYNSNVECSGKICASQNFVCFLGGKIFGS